MSDTVPMVSESCIRSYPQGTSPGLTTTFQDINGDGPVKANTSRKATNGEKHEGQNGQVDEATGYKWSRDEDAPGYSWNNRRAQDEELRTIDHFVGSRKGLEDAEAWSRTFSATHCGDIMLNCETRAVRSLDIHLSTKNACNRDCYDRAEAGLDERPSDGMGKDLRTSAVNIEAS